MRAKHIRTIRMDDGLTDRYPADTKQVEFYDTDDYGEIEVIKFRDSNSCEVYDTKIRNNKETGWLFTAECGLMPEIYTAEYIGAMCRAHCIGRQRGRKESQQD